MEEGRRWSVQHRIAGIVFETESNERIPGLDNDHFRRFTVLHQEPDVRHFLWKVDDPAEIRGRSAPGWRRGQHWAMSRDEKRRSLEIRYLSDAGEANLPGRQGTEFFIAANLRQIFSSFLPAFSAILLHSSGVVRGDRAALFLAPDEGGKTTAARLGEGSPLLSGDHVIVRERDGEFTAHATPLGGETVGPCQARVGGLFVLRKAAVFRLAPLSAREVLQRLWAEHRNYTLPLPRELKRRSFELLSDLCCRTSLREMAFPREYVDWVEIDRVMRERDCG